MRLTNHMSPLKAESFSGWFQRGRSEIWSMERLQYTFLGLKMEGPHDKKFGWPSEAERNHLVTASQ